MQHIANRKQHWIGEKFCSVCVMQLSSVCTSVTVGCLLAKPSQPFFSVLTCCICPHFPYCLLYTFHTRFLYLVLCHPNYNLFDVYIFSLLINLKPFPVSLIYDFKCSGSVALLMNGHVWCSSCISQLFQK